MIPKKNELLTMVFSGVVFLSIGFLILIGLSNYFRSRYKDRLFPGVYINNQSAAYVNRHDLKKLYNNQENNINHISLTIYYEKDIVATISSRILNVHLNVDETFDRAYTVGRSSHLLPRIKQTLLGVLGLKKAFFHLTAIYNKQALIDILSRIEEGKGKKPKDARFQFENGKVSVFEKEENGLKIETGYALAYADRLINEAILRPRPIKITVASSITKPTITLGQTNTFGIEELIGEGVSDFTHSIPERIYNLTLASSKFNGVLIPKNEIFSFNKALGDVSSSTGYKHAYIIKDGKTVLGDGGGICQVSTTLFRAALNTGLPITEHHSHAYRVTYYENDAKPGLDATVFAPSVDLKIKNNTPAYILIQTYIEKDTNVLHFYLFGKKDGRTIELTQPLVYDIFAAPEPVYQDDPTIQRGVVRQVDFAAPSGKSSYSYKVKDANNKILFEKHFLISYRPWRAVFLVGTAN